MYTEDVTESKCCIFVVDKTDHSCSYKWQYMKSYKRNEDTFFYNIIFMLLFYLPICHDSKDCTAKHYADPGTGLMLSAFSLPNSNKKTCDFANVHRQVEVDIFKIMSLKMDIQYGVLLNSFSDTTESTYTDLKDDQVSLFHFALFLCDVLGQSALLPGLQHLVSILEVFWILHIT